MGQVATKQRICIDQKTRVPLGLCKEVHSGLKEAKGATHPCIRKAAELAMEILPLAEAMSESHSQFKILAADACELVHFAVGIWGFQSGRRETITSLKLHSDEVLRILEKIHRSASREGLTRFFSHFTEEGEISGLKLEISDVTQKLINTSQQLMQEKLDQIYRINGIIYEALLATPSAPSVLESDLRQPYLSSVCPPAMPSWHSSPRLHPQTLPANDQSHIHIAGSYVVNNDQSNITVRDSGNVVNITTKNSNNHYHGLMARHDRPQRHCGGM